MKRAIAACEKAGTGGRVMVDIGGVETRALISEILDLLPPGDILTHAYTDAPNLAGDFTNIVQDGRLLPAALAAKERGVVFDVGKVAAASIIPWPRPPSRKAARLTRSPPTSTSLPATRRACPYLTWVMSKFLGVGFPLEEVVAMATVTRRRSSTAC